MRDLKNLESKLILALEFETSESLTEWILSKRDSQNKSLRFILPHFENSNFSDKENNPIHSNYSLAA